MKAEENKKEINLICEPGIGFSQRDKNIKIQEEKGLFGFLVIRNTGENNQENFKKCWNYTQNTLHICFIWTRDS